MFGIGQVRNRVCWVPQCPCVSILRSMSLLALCQVWQQHVQHDQCSCLSQQLNVIWIFEWQAAELISCWQLSSSLVDLLFVDLSNWNIGNKCPEYTHGFIKFIRAPKMLCWNAPALWKSKESKCIPLPRKHNIRQHLAFCLLFRLLPYVASCLKWSI